MLLYSNHLNINDLYKNIEDLILNQKKLKKFQNLNYKNFKFDHNYISNLIDKIRSSFMVNKAFIIKKKNLLR